MLDKSYARPDLLVDTDWVAEHGADPGVRLVDMGPRLGQEPRAHRIAGSVSPRHPYFKGTEDSRFVAGPAEIKAIFEALSIDDDTLVVAYDSALSLNAARLWWALSYYGHRAFKIMDGGFDKWVAEERPVVKSPGKVKAEASFSPRADAAILSTIDTLRAAVNDDDAAVWDTRTVEEYSGEEMRGNARAGHVPGAKHLEWSELMANDGTFRPADQMRAALESVGITRNKHIHTY